MLKENLLPIIDMLSKSTYLEFIDNRISMLKIMCEMYEDNPLKIINEITNREDDYKKDQRELAQQQKIAEKKEQLNKENKTTKKVPITIKEDSAHGIIMIYNDDFESIILSLRIIIISLFCVYIIYSVLYYIFLKKAFNRLKLLVSYSSINASIANYLYDSIIAMEYIHMTNSSSQDLSLIISDKDSDYVNEAINSFIPLLKIKSTSSQCMGLFSLR